MEHKIATAYIFEYRSYEEDREGWNLFLVRFDSSPLPPLGVTPLVYLRSRRSRKAMGPGPFEVALTESLGKAGAATLLAALTAPNRDTSSARVGSNGGGFSRGVGGDSRGRGGAGAASAGGGGCRNSVAAGRPSIREQMMAAKRKKQEEEKQRRAAKEDEAGDRATGKAGGFVIVT